MTMTHNNLLNLLAFPPTLFFSWLWNLDLIVTHWLWNKFLFSLGRELLICVDRLQLNITPV